MDRDRLLDQLPHLRRYARALTADRWSADDLVQDTLERACGKWHLWTVGSDLRAWLLTVMHNLYLNQQRKATVRLLDIDEVPHPAAPDSGVDDALDLSRCVARLPPEQRAVLLLVTLEDLSYAEAARILKVPVGTVMSRLSRARSRLRELMEAEPDLAGANALKPASPVAQPTLRRLK